MALIESSGRLKRGARAIFSPVVIRPWQMLSKRRGLTKLRYNTSIYNKAIKAKEDYKSARKEGVSAKDLTELANISAYWAEVTLSEARPNFVRADAHDAVIKQIQKNESVYPSHELDTFRSRMTAGRDCFAETLETEDGTKILAHIFRAHMRVPETQGRIAYQDLPGRVDLILDGTHEGLGASDSNLTAYFAISSKWLKSGPELIADLAQVTPKGRIEVTTSPMPDFLKKHDVKRMTDDEFQQALWTHLQNGVEDSSQRDGVAGFHVHQNGASVAKAHLNPMAWPIVNYLYNRDAVNDNLGRLKHGLLPVSPLVYGQMTNEQIKRGVYNVGISAYIP